MTQKSLDLTKNLRNTRKFIDLPYISTHFWEKIYYFIFPLAKYQRQCTERHRKTTRRLQNQRFYANHRDELIEKRKDYYAETGK